MSVTPPGLRGWPMASFDWLQLAAGRPWLANVWPLVATRYVTVLGIQRDVPGLLASWGGQRVVDSWPPWPVSSLWCRASVGCYGQLAG